MDSVADLIAPAPPPPSKPLTLEERVEKIEKDIISIRRLVRLVLGAVVAARLLGPDTVAKIVAIFAP